MKGQADRNQVGDVDNNLNRADAVLSRANIKDLDLLVLPELAFSGSSHFPASSPALPLTSGRVQLPLITAYQSFPRTNDFWHHISLGANDGVEV